MASAAASSSSMLPTLCIPNISYLVFVKLFDNNYLVWKSQVKMFLLGQHFWCFIDDSYPCPPYTITHLSPTEKYSDHSPPPILNPNFTLWFQTDQSLVSILCVTLSECVITRVVGFLTSKEIWDRLKNLLNKLLPMKPNSNLIYFPLLKAPKQFLLIFLMQNTLQIN